MKPMYSKESGKWHISVETDEFGSVLLLKKGVTLAIPAAFDTKTDAEIYIKDYQQEHHGGA